MRLHPSMLTDAENARLDLLATSVERWRSWTRAIGGVNFAASFVNLAACVEANRGNISDRAFWSYQLTMLCFSLPLNLWLLRRWEKSWLAFGLEVERLREHYRSS